MTPALWREVYDNDPLKELQNRKPINQVNDLLFIGSAASRNFILEYAIDHVISIGSEGDRKNYSSLPENVTETKLQFGDSYNVDIIVHILACNTILDDLKKENKKCLVHCREGISRSASIVIGYLMYSEKLHAVEAYRKLEKKRLCIYPNANFWSTLQDDYEKLIFKIN